MRDDQRNDVGRGFGAPNERLTLDQAMRAITIDAAYMLNMEDSIGSIQAGKCADFAVMDKDPYDVGVDGLQDIAIWGTRLRRACIQGDDTRTRLSAAGAVR